MAVDPFCYRFRPPPTHESSTEAWFRPVHACPLRRRWKFGTNPMVRFVVDRVRCGRRKLRSNRSTLAAAGWRLGTDAPWRSCGTDARTLFVAARRGWWRRRGSARSLSLFVAVVWSIVVGFGVLLFLLSSFRVMVFVPFLQPCFKGRNRTRLGPPPPDHRESFFVAHFPLGHQIQNNTRGRSRDPPRAVHQDIAVAQSLGKEPNNGSFVGLEFGKRCGSVVDRYALVDDLGGSFGKVVGDSRLDVGLFGRRDVQDVGNLPAVHQFVVVLRIGLSPNVHRMPQGTSGLVLDGESTHQTHRKQTKRSGIHSVLCGAIVVCLL